jgi:hypothetical protein
MLDKKQVYQSAKKELDEESKRKLINEMKGYIQKTLQAIEDCKGDIAVKQQELKALKADLSDLENGRLDRIKERQDKDPIAKRVTTIIIERIIEKYPQVIPYFQPYYVPYSPPSCPTAMCSSGTGGTNSISGTNYLYSKAEVSGTYTTLCSGNTKPYYLG